MPEANRSVFGGLLAGDAGIDPYTRQASNVYHNLFAEGSYIGKGIYNVRAFETTLEGRFPENRVLSHDLIEGCFASCGFVGDVQLFEGVPSGFLADMNRRRRWIRGDWQIASWLWPKIPTARGKTRNPLSGLSCWKIFDNLRLSLTPIFQLTFIAIGCVLAPALAWYWVVLALLMASGRLAISALIGFFRKPEDKPLALHLKDQSRTCLRIFLAETVFWSNLPYTALCAADAIVRVIYRLLFSRTKMLEWVTSSEAETRCKCDLPSHYKIMWPCVAISLVLAAVLAAVHSQALLLAGPMLLLWLAGPLMAWRISQPRCANTVNLTDHETRQVRRWARQTWHFFEIHQNEDEHWLTPDNVQHELPGPNAPRTSPTNMGMCLMSNLAACDLGYISPAALLERTRRTFQSMLRMDQYRGHFYNWYDTRTLKPLEPRYVSSVDSGNLWCAGRAQPGPGRTSR